MVKGFKYNFILISLIVIIGFVVGTSNGFLLSNSDSPKEDIPEEEIPVEDGENTTIPDGFSPPSADANAYERISFAFRILQEGKGFQSVMSQEVNAAGSQQKIYTKQYRGEGYNLYEQWLDADISMAKFGFYSAYSDTKTVKYKEITNRNNYSFKDKSYNYPAYDTRKTYTAQDYIKNFKNVNDFPLTINESTANLIKYDKRTDPDYYIIKISFNISKVDTEYINSFRENGTGETNFTSITITFKISKKTGFFSKIDRDESFFTKFAGMPINCSAKIVQVFTGMNISAKPALQEISAKSFIF